MGTLGFFIYPGGEAIGLLCSLIYLALGSFFLHKLFLSFLYTRELQSGHPLKTASDRICTQLNIESVKVYFSDNLPRNIYLLDSFFGQPVAIVGSHFLDGFDPKVSENLLKLIYRPLSTQDVARKTQVVWMVSLLWLPILLLEKVYFIRVFVWPLKLLLLPIVWLKNLLVEEQKVSAEELINLGVQPTIKDSTFQSSYLRLLEVDFSMIKFEEQDLASTLLKLPSLRNMEPSNRGSM